MNPIKVNIYQGDDFSKQLRVTKEGFDFTGFSVECMVRKPSVNAKKEYEMNISPIYSTLGQMDISLDIPSSVTVGFLGEYVASVQISRALPSYPKTTIILFSIVVLPNPTR